DQGKGTYHGRMWFWRGTATRACITCLIATGPDQCPAQREACDLDAASASGKHGGPMVPIQGLFESHLTVMDLERSMTFFGQTLGLELAEVFWERRVAFYWVGGQSSMLGIWEVGTAPQRLSLHLAFRTDLQDLLDAPARFRAANVVPLDFQG